MAPPDGCGIAFPGNQKVSDFGWLEGIIGRLPHRVWYAPARSIGCAGSGRGDAELVVARRERVARQIRKGGRAAGRALLVLGTLVALLVGCMHTPEPIPPQSIEAYAFRQEQVGVRVAVDPYFTIDRLKLAFTGGEDFPRDGLLPVRLILENGSGGEVQVSPRNFAWCDAMAAATSLCRFRMRLPW